MNRLKELRTERELTTGQLSAYTSIDRTTLSRLDNEVRPFTQEHITILSKFFNVSTDYLLGMDDNFNSLSYKLKEARIKKGLSQIDVAKIINIGNKTISDYERGVSSPDPETIKKLATLYNVTTDYLLGMQDNSKLFSARIKELRLERNLTCEELGKIMGVSKVSVWQWENNINYPNNKILIKLTNFFNVTSDYLLGLPNSNINLSFGVSQKIKHLREKNKKSQEELASSLNVKRYTVSDWENERTEPNIESIIKLCKIFNVSADYLLGIETSNFFNESDEFITEVLNYSSKLTTNQKNFVLKMLSELTSENNRF